MRTLTWVGLAICIGVSVGCGNSVGIPESTLSVSGAVRTVDELPQVNETPTVPVALAPIEPELKPVAKKSAPDDARDSNKNFRIWGVGLVVGLNGTGGESKATQQRAFDTMRKLETTTKLARQSILDQVFASKNIAMVMVTADLPASARKGSNLDITVSVIDDAQSLEGGTLILAPLRGADGAVYAVAQGQLAIGEVQIIPVNASENRVIPTIARGRNGAIVEREVPEKVAPATVER